jgi:putative endonuclease
MTNAGDDGVGLGVERIFYVYIMASQRNGTLYTGVTSNLSRRVYEHREGLIKGFTSKYGVTMLVWYEDFPTADEAITSEKRIKRWRRAWKLELIEKLNPQWLDLYLTFNQ